MARDLVDAAAGCLLGLALGDALGAPFEFEPAGSPRLEHWDGGFADGGPWHLPAGRFTDDTMMALALAEALCASDGMYDPDRVARGYLHWFDSGDHRGIGLTTAEALGRLADGVPPEESGLSGPNRSGNGTAMRIAPLGIVTDDHDRLRADAAMDAAITHRDEKASAGSRAVACGVAMLARGVAPDLEWAEAVARCASEEAVAERVRRASALAADRADPAFALGTLGTGGYVVETVASAVYLAVRFGGTETGNVDAHAALVAAVRAGDDTDTTAAVAGAFCGALAGASGLPPRLLADLEARDRIDGLGRRLASLADLTI